MRVQRTGTGLAHPFRIMSGATSRLAVTAGRLDQVQVGGAKVPAGEQGLTVLPGRYTVKVPPADPLFAATSAAPAQIDVPATADQRATPIRPRAWIAVPAPQIFDLIRGVGVVRQLRRGGAMLSSWVTSVSAMAPGLTRGVGKTRHRGARTK